MTSEIIHGDCLEVLRDFPDNHFDSVVTDPPYGLEFMGKTWDGSDGFRRSLNAADTGRDNVFGRTSKTSPEYRVTGAVPQSGKRPVSDQPGSHDEGYRNMKGKEPLFQQWCELWAAAECLRVLKPGGHLLAFGGTRTYHRMACAIEDAGFEIRDSLHWIYGSGFPKSLDVSKAIDKQAGAERKVIGRGNPMSSLGVMHDDDWKSNPEYAITAPATEDATRWEGWGTALKPAHEPVVVARKPLTGTVAANVLQFGTGALNIDGTRVGNEAVTTHSRGQNTAFPKRPGETTVEESGRISRQDGISQEERAGRFPPNILLSEDAAAEMDRQSGTLTSGTGAVKRATGKGYQPDTLGGKESREVGTPNIEYGDTGGASRFFPVFRYQAKAPQKERPKVDGIAHPTCKPLELMRWLVRLVTPPGGLCLDPFAGTGTTGQACRLEGFSYVLIEREEDYIKLINARMYQEPTLFDDF